MSDAHDNARVPRLAGIDVAVCGDIVCDHDLFTEPRKLSREAPVMVVRHRGERMSAGGAANVARNLRALGASVHLFGAVGTDRSGREVRALLEDEGVDVSGVVSVRGWTTPTKTRVLAAEPRRSPRQILRIDAEPAEPVTAELRREVSATVSGLKDRAGCALIVSDYDYGMVGAELGGAARAVAEAGHVVLLDPRSVLEGFEGLSALTPNVGELAHFTGRSEEVLAGEGELAEAAAELLDRTRARHLLVTRGNEGMALFGADRPAGGTFVRASGTDEITDVTGAGDTAAAVFALGLAAGRDAVEAMVLANAASGVVVLEHGAAVCGTEALAVALAGAPRPPGVNAIREVRP